MNAGRHARRDPRLRASTECPECWSSVTKQGRCAPCIDYRAGRIDAETWKARVLRSEDTKLLPTIIPPGKAIIVGTPLYTDDLHERMKKVKPYTTLKFDGNIWKEETDHGQAGK